METASVVDVHQSLLDLNLRYMNLHIELLQKHAKVSRKHGRVVADTGCQLNELLLRASGATSQKSQGETTQTS